MKDFKLNIEYLPVKALKPYEKNARKHNREDVSVIMKSIEKYGFSDPIGIWSDNNIIVEGHGRVEACKKLGIKEVPVIRLDHLTDEERRQYALMHNKTAELSSWDFDVLGEELQELDFGDLELDWGVGNDAVNDLKEDVDNPYTAKIDIPQYNITGECPNIEELVDNSKQKELEDKILQANISNEKKEFLLKASQRHLCFNYANIAEYYAHQNKEMQELMEMSALVIIDFNDAIKNGYAELKKDMMECVEDEK